mgnify:CR=1 FL=1|tara:strand:+ start:380 stop:664 length:285 start_codon:yes stop_codon:yes gene_type:complete
MPSNDHVMFVVVNFDWGSAGDGAVYLPPPITGCMLGKEYSSLEMVKIGGVKIDAYMVAAKVTPIQYKKFQNKLTYCNLLTTIKNSAPKCEIVCR